MKKAFICGLAAFFLIFSAPSLFAQQEFLSGKQFYTELGGPGTAMSIHFDSRFRAMERLGLDYRVGIGFTTQSEYIMDLGRYQTRTAYSIPLGINYVFGKNNSPHTFEMGAGAAFLTQKIDLFSYNEDDRQGHFIGFCTFMYRRAPENGGFCWRVGLTPIIGASGNLFPMCSIGFGYAF